MNRRALHIKTVFRFNKWSRKAYAVFRSIGQCVSIGQLSLDLSEHTLKKQESYRTACLLLNEKEEETVAETENPPGAEPENRFFLLPVASDLCPEHPCYYISHPIQNRKAASYLPVSGFSFSYKTHIRYD